MYRLRLHCDEVFFSPEFHGLSYLEEREKKSVNSCPYVEKNLMY